MYINGLMGRTGSELWKNDLSNRNSITIHWPWQWLIDYSIATVYLLNLISFIYRWNSIHCFRSDNWIGNRKGFVTIFFRQFLRILVLHWFNLHWEILTTYVTFLWRWKQTNVISQAFFNRKPIAIKYHWKKSRYHLT